MLALIGSHTPCVLFKYLFLQQLPEYVRAPLSCSIIIDYRDLALEADKIFLAGREKHLQEVNSTSSTPSKNTVTDDVCWYHRTRGAKQGGVGGVSTPPEFWMGGLSTCQPPLILRKKFLGGVGSP